jgi:hypothetical protein
MPRSSWALCVDTPQHQDQRCPVRASCRQCDAYAGFQLPDAHGDLQERASKSFKSCAAPSRVPWGCAAQFQQQPVGTGVQKQPELVGLPAMAGSAVGFGVEFVFLDQVFHFTPSAIDLFIKMFAAPAQVGDDEAHICSLSGSLDAGNDKAFLRPASGPVPGLEKAAEFFLVSTPPACCHIFAPGGRERLQPAVARSRRMHAFACRQWKGRGYRSSPVVPEIP